MKENLSNAAALLNEPGIEFNGDRISGYEYKHWTPVLIPFIQASTNIWEPQDDGRLPYFKFIPAGSSWDFQMFTPKDHPFLLMDIKVAATLRMTFNDDPPDTAVQPRWKSVFDFTTQLHLFHKYLFPNNENVETTLTAVSPGGKPVWGGFQNVTGLINSVRTIGPEPHVERIPLSNTQSARSGKGSLQHHLLFPEDGIIKVTVENRNVDASPVPGTPDGVEVNGLVFGYVIMR